ARGRPPGHPWRRPGGRKGGRREGGGCRRRAWLGLGELVGPDLPARPPRRATGRRFPSEENRDRGCKGRAAWAWVASGLGAGGVALPRSRQPPGFAASLTMTKLQGADDGGRLR